MLLPLSDEGIEGMMAKFNSRLVSVTTIPHATAIRRANGMEITLDDFEADLVELSIDVRQDGSIKVFEGEYQKSQVLRMRSSQITQKHAQFHWRRGREGKKEKLAPSRHPGPQVSLSGTHAAANKVHCLFPCIAHSLPIHLFVTSRSPLIISRSPLVISHDPLVIIRNPLVIRRNALLISRKSPRH
jgi:hypothetical protein